MYTYVQSHTHVLIFHKCGAQMCKVQVYTDIVTHSSTQQSSSYTDV